MQEMDLMEIDSVSGGISKDAIYGGALAVACTLLGVGVAVCLVIPTAVVGAVALGASIAASGVAIAVGTD
ncbi:MAG: hypothetical protein V4582_16320 [Pseudomonadota bacterium]